MEECVLLISSFRFQQHLSFSCSPNLRHILRSVFFPANFRPGNFKGKRGEVKRCRRNLLNTRARETDGCVWRMKHSLQLVGSRDWTGICLMSPHVTCFCRRLGLFWLPWSSGSMVLRISSHQTGLDLLERASVGIWIACALPRKQGKECCPSWRQAGRS